MFERQYDPVSVLVCVCACACLCVCACVDRLHTNKWESLEFRCSERNSHVRVDVWEFKHLPVLSLDNSPELVGVIKSCKQNKSLSNMQTFVHLISLLHRCNFRASVWLERSYLLWLHKHSSLVEFIFAHSRQNHIDFLFLFLIRYSTELYANHM